MQIVIDISEEMYNFACNYPEKVLAGYSLCIKNGTPLPKHHGRLVDASNLLTVTDIREDGTESTYVPYEEIEDAPTIIEADTESEDKE